MYEFIRGKVVAKSPAQIVLDVGGVGYRLLIPLSTFEKIPDNGEATLLTHFYVRDDVMSLYGFATAEERDLFEALISISGVGPATALALISSHSVDSIKRAVSEENATLLGSVKGIGKKTAHRIILELKGYLAASTELREGLRAGERSPAADAVLALERLGYSRGVAERAVLNAQKRLGPEASADDLVREALRHV